MSLIFCRFVLMVYWIYGDGWFRLSTLHFRILNPGRKDEGDEMRSMQIRGSKQRNEMQHKSGIAAYTASWTRKICDITSRPKLFFYRKMTHNS